MKNIYTFTLFILISVLAGCDSVKQMYKTGQVSDGLFNKLLSGYANNAFDTANQSQLLYAYNILNNQYLNNVNKYKSGTTLASKESLVKSLSTLNSFYKSIGNYGNATQFLNVGNVASDLSIAKLSAADAWYNYAEDLVKRRDVQSSRTAIGAINKIKGWVTNFRDLDQLEHDAYEQAIIYVLIEPLRTEGFYSGNFYNNRQDGFTRQIVQDLGSAWNNTSSFYRVYDNYTEYYRNMPTNWVVEPVITEMSISPIRNNKTVRTVTKQVDANPRDTSKVKNTVTLKANIITYETYVIASGTVEVRITDVNINQRVDRRSFTERYTYKQTYVTYEGDKNALSKEDLALLRPRQEFSFDERNLKEQVLMDIYPSVVNYIRNKVRF